MKYFVTTRLSENMAETPEGYLLCIGVPIARTGEMVYGEGEIPLEADDSGKIIIYRDEKEVFDTKTMASFEGKAVTIQHPKEFVGPNNWASLTKGIMQNVRRGKGEEKDSLIADLLITDSLAISLVKNGLREVSCGYEADMDQTEDGKGTQTNIRGNHLALVQKGRAGSAYAIKDHKEKGETSMTKLEKLLVKLGLAKDSAMAKVIDEAMKEDESKKDEKKEEKAADAGIYDELVKAVKDLGEKVSGLMKAKDEGKKDEGEKEEKAKDEGDKSEEKKDSEEKAKDEGEKSMEERLKVLELAVSKMLEGKAKDEEKKDDEAKDEDMDAEDNDFEESSMVGDTAERAEILAPGIEITKDVKAKALKTAYGTKEGKKVIDAFTGGKSPVYDSAEKVDQLFIAVSELLKVSRQSELAKARSSVKDNATEEQAMTPEKINEINLKFYNKKGE